MASGSDIKAGGAAVEITANDSAFEKVLKQSEVMFKTWGSIMGQVSKTASAAVKNAFGAMATAANALHKPLDAVQKKLESIGKGLKDAGSAMKDAGAKMIGASAVIGTPLLGAADDYARQGAGMARASEKSGVGVPALSQLKYAADDSGVDFEQLQTGLTKMQKGISDAGKGAQEPADALKEIGLSAANLMKMAPEKQFQAIADGLSKIQNPTEKVAEASRIFGKAVGPDLIPLLNEGGEGIQKLMQRADSLGLTMSGQAAAGALDFSKKLDDLWAVVQMGVFKVGGALAPALGQVAKSLTGASSAAGDFITKHQGLVVGLGLAAAALGGLGVAVVAAGAVLGALGTMATVAAGGIGLLTGAIGFMVSPFGLVIAAVGAAGYALIRFSGIGRTIGNYLSAAFGTMKDDAVGAFGGIANALASGQWGMAAKIAWTFIQLEFQRGSLMVQGLWAGAVTKLKEGWSYAVEYLSNWDGIKTAAEKAMAWMVNSWQKAVDYVADILQHLFFDTSKKDLSANIEYINKSEASGRITHEQAAKMRADTERQMGDYNATQHSDRDQQQASEYAAQQKALDDAYHAKQPGLVDQQEAKRKQEEEDLKKQLASLDPSNSKAIADLQAQLKALEDSAKTAAAATAKTIPPLKDLSKIGDDADDKKPPPFNAKNASDGTKEASKSLVAGMFGGANAGQVFGAGSNTHAAATAKNTAITNQKLTEVIKAIAKSGHAGELTFG